MLAGLRRDVSANLGEEQLDALETRLRPISLGGDRRGHAVDGGAHVADRRSALGVGAHADALTSAT